MVIWLSESIFVSLMLSGLADENYLRHLIWWILVSVSDIVTVVVRMLLKRW